MPVVRRGQTQQQDAVSDMDGSVDTPATAATRRNNNGTSTMMAEIARMIGRMRISRRGGGGGGGQDSSDMEAEEEAGERVIIRTVQDAHDYERQMLVHRMQGIREEDETGDDAAVMDEAREREREAVRTSRRNGRWTKVKCFMCSYGNHEHDGTADKGSQAYVTLRNMIRQRYAYSDLMTLCMDCSEYYRVALWEKSRQADGSHLLPEMLPSDFYDHIIYHNMNPQIMIGEDLRLIRDLLLVLRVQLTNATGKTGLRIIDTIIKLMKQKALYLSQGARPLMFEGRGGNDPIGLDVQAMGDVANMTRIRPFLQSRHANVIGGATATNTSQPRPGMARFDRTSSAVASHDVEEDDDDGVDAMDVSVQTSSPSQSS